MKQPEQVKERTWVSLVRNAVVRHSQGDAANQVLPILFAIYPDYLVASFASIHVMRSIFKDFPDGQATAEEVRRISRLFLPHPETVKT